MSCDVGKATEGLENELWRRWSGGMVGEWAELIDIEIHSRTYSQTFPSLHLRHNSFSNPSFASPTSQALHRAHSPTFQSLHLRHSSFSNPSVALSTSQFILQPFFRFSYVTSCSLSSPGEPPMYNIIKLHIGQHNLHMWAWECTEHSMNLATNF